MTVEKDYWFPAQRCGYGWGPPVRWQGWLVMLVWQQPDPVPHDLNPHRCR